VPDPGAAYAEGRQRLTALLADTDEAVGRTPVPACPDWAVADVIAHLTGICADVLAGNMEGVATDSWTEAQVSARRTRALDDVLGEWSEVAPQVEAMAGQFGPTGYQWVADLATHEHDVRGALGVPGGRDSVATGIGVDFMVTGFLEGVEGRGLAPLAVRAGDQERRSRSDVEPAAVLVVEPFEVLRALTGRRSIEQVRALDWQGDPGPYLPALQWGPFSPREDPLLEP